MYTGALIEGFITFVSRTVALESTNWDAQVAKWTNSVLTVILVIAGKTL